MAEPKPIYQYKTDEYILSVILVNDHFNVRFSFIDKDWITTIESCETKEHALHGAKQFPEFYEMAIDYGYYMNGLEFLHPDGRTVDLTCTMDLDRTKESFLELLITGETVDPMVGS